MQDRYEAMLKLGRMEWGVLTMALIMIGASPSNAQDLLPDVQQRFQAYTEEVPDFQKHVVPLFGRLGCNGRACHGAFQGQGGFQLSLFGYDFAADHKALFSEDSPRVDLESIEDSLILFKPTDEDEHEGD